MPENSETLTISAKAGVFIDGVLRLKPRLAVFDCDGTLWAGDCGEGFFYWELGRGIVSDEIARWARMRYQEYRNGKVSEDEMCGEMVTMHRGLSETSLRAAAEQYFEENVAARIFPDMRELVRRLGDSGCDIWAVSSTNEWVIRAGMKHCGIAEDQVLAAAVEIENGLITDRLIRVPSGPGKTTAIQEVVGKLPDAAFGNSRWDFEMLAMARYGFAVNPNPDLEKSAQERAWTIYWPDQTRG